MAKCTTLDLPLAACPAQRCRVKGEVTWPCMCDHCGSGGAGGGGGGALGQGRSGILRLFIGEAGGPKAEPHGEAEGAAAEPFWGETGHHAKAAAGTVTLLPGAPGETPPVPPAGYPPCGPGVVERPCPPQGDWNALPKFGRTPEGG